MLRHQPKATTWYYSLPTLKSCAWWCLDDRTFFLFVIISTPYLCGLPFITSWYTNKQHEWQTSLQVRYISQEKETIITWSVPLSVVVFFFIFTNFPLQLQHQLPISTIFTIGRSYLLGHPCPPCFMTREA
jgi:hypothetical protein